MTRRSRPARFALLFVTLAAPVMSAAAPLPPDAPDELIARANAALRAGEVARADKLYAAAEERATDPGLVAYNRAAVHFERKQYREAERDYDRVLDDAACPPARAARAWYNRGTCLLHRGGSLDVYRAAIACFENALDNPAADADVIDRAPRNLELAKLLWNEKRKEAAKPEEESPNKKPPPEETKQPPPQKEPDKRPGDSGAPDEIDPATGKPVPKPGAQPDPQPPKTEPKSGDGPNTAGNNTNLPVLEDRDQPQKLTPDEARKYLRDTAPRRKRELHALLDSLYGPDRPGVRDW
jgi:tetratricopeptide (TPR) repeat protein